jgi:hypothetical protein
MFVQLYLLDMEKIEQFNEIFKGYFPAEPPARAVCQPLKLYPGTLVMFTTVACVAQRVRLAAIRCTSQLPSLIPFDCDRYSLLDTGHSPETDSGPRVAVETKKPYGRVTGQLRFL